jgi:hypothetical protein
MADDIRERSKAPDEVNRAALFRAWRKTLRLLVDQGKSEVGALAIFLRNNLDPPFYLQHKHIDQSQNQGASWYINKVKAANAETDRWLKLAAGALQLASMSKEDFDQMRASIGTLTDEQMPKELREKAISFLSQFEKALKKRTILGRGQTRKTWRNNVIKDAVELAIAEFKKTKAAAYRLVSKALSKIEEDISAERVGDIHKGKYSTDFSPHGN